MHAFVFVVLLNAAFLALVWWSFDRLNELQQKRLQRWLTAACVFSFFTYVFVFPEQAEALIWSWVIVVCVLKVVFELIEKWLEHRAVS